MTPEVTRAKLLPMKPSQWDTVYGRIFYLIDLKIHELAGQKTQRQLSNAIFGNETRIATLRTRYRKGGGEDVPGKTLRQVSDFFGVSLDWLNDNRGWPSEQVRAAFEVKTPERRSTSDMKMRAVQHKK